MSDLFSRLTDALISGNLNIELTEEDKKMLPASPTMHDWETLLGAVTDMERRIQILELDHRLRVLESKQGDDNEPS